MISTKTQYKIYNGKLLAIVETFKTWCNYYKSCKYELFVHINFNNFYHFMDTKSLSSRQICLAQKLFQYHFEINYCQNKAKVVVDALSEFS